MEIAKITACSNMNDFLDSNQFREGQIVKYIANMEKDVIDKIDKEMKTGGLDQWSLNIDGNPVAYRHAGIIKENIADIDEEICKCLEEILKKADSHREEELITYITKINEKLSLIDEKIKYYKGEITTCDSKLENQEYADGEAKFEIELWKEQCETDLAASENEKTRLTTNKEAAETELGKIKE